MLQQVRGIIIKLTSSYCTLINPPHLMNIEHIDDIHPGWWPKTCSMLLISFFMAIAVDRKDCLFLIRKSIPLHSTGYSTNFYIRDTLIPLNSTKICMNEHVSLHDVWHSKSWLKRSLCFTEFISKIFFTQRISQVRQIFFRQMCLCNEFTKVSCCQSFPPYSMYI